MPPMNDAVEEGSMENAGKSRVNLARKRSKTHGCAKHGANCRHGANGHAHGASAAVEGVLTESGIKTENHGIVVHVESLDHFHRAARLTEAKGLIWARGAADAGVQRAMESWVRDQAEPEQDFAHESVRIDRIDPSALWKACKRLSASLPGQFRDVIERDARLCAEVMLAHASGDDEKAMTFAVEIVERNACARWHQDNYVGRVIITYTGSGTWMVDDESVRFDQFEPTVGASINESDARIVPDFHSIHVAPLNAISLMKGERWPGIRGNGLTHKVRIARSP